MCVQNLETYIVGNFVRIFTSMRYVVLHFSVESFEDNTALTWNVSHKQNAWTISHKWNHHTLQMMYNECLSIFTIYNWEICLNIHINNSRIAWTPMKVSDFANDVQCSSIWIYQGDTCTTTLMQ